MYKLSLDQLKAQQTNTQSNSADTIHWKVSTDYKLRGQPLLFSASMSADKNKKTKTWGTFALVAGRVIVDEVVFCRRNLPHSQLDKIPESRNIFYSQQIISFRGIGGNLHNLVYSGNIVSNSNHKDFHTTQFQCIGIWYGQVLNLVWLAISDQEDPFSCWGTATFDKEN